MLIDAFVLLEVLNAHHPGIPPLSSSEYQIKLSTESHSRPNKPLVAQMTSLSKRSNQKAPSLATRALDRFDFGGFQNRSKEFSQKSLYLSRKNY